MAHRTATLALPALLLAAALPAQSPGDLVRVRGAPTEGWRTGRLVALTDSVLVLRLGAAAVTDSVAGGPAAGDGRAPTAWLPPRDSTIPLAAVQQFEVRRHQARRWPRAVGGGLVGGVVGGLLGVAISYQTDDPDSDVRRLVGLFGAVVAGTVGLVVGAVRGAASAKPARWEPAALPRLAPR